MVAERPVRPPCPPPTAWFSSVSQPFLDAEGCIYAALKVKVHDGALVHREREEEQGDVVVVGDSMGRTLPVIFSPCWSSESIVRALTPLSHTSSSSFCCSSEEEEGVPTFWVRDLHDTDNDTHGNEVASSPTPLPSPHAIFLSFHAGHKAHTTRHISGGFFGEDDSGEGDAPPPSGLFVLTRGRPWATQRMLEACIEAAEGARCCAARDDGAPPAQHSSSADVLFMWQFVVRGNQCYAVVHPNSVRVLGEDREDHYLIYAGEGDVERPIVRYMRRVVEEFDGKRGGSVSPEAHYLKVYNGDNKTRVAHQTFIKYVEYITRTFGDPNVMAVLCKEQGGPSLVPSALETWHNVLHRALELELAGSSSSSFSSSLLR